ncbi:hypothetical protein [Streptomyces sp. MP131-18]|uniref:hypothetical protein n=1 Tax=Streptomyces sp. MP131-18 TaxID=1857892 RepID=UPI00097CBFF3|nr:hypothetical protein [Streptomyces sp. MP131-18]ONK12662.1 hypothetical protein STBA_34100 [Streptomyces sp. MP131-18]
MDEPAFPFPPPSGGLAPAIRGVSQRLIRLDNVPGAPSVAGPAARAFCRVHALCAAGGAPLPPRYAREVRAAAAELAGVAGWALFDAERHAAAVPFNRAALALARRAGDRDTELLTLQNAALRAEWLGSHRSALALARAVLVAAAPLPPRAEAVFRVRAAQGAAATGPQWEAERAFARARALLAWDGGRRPEPPWAWWLTEQEIDGQQGGAYQAAGQWRLAIPLLRRAAGGGHAGYRGIFAVRLLDCLLSAGAWREAEEVAAELIPAVARGASSARTRRLLTAALGRGDRLPGVPPGLRDLLRRPAG